jgi:hemerythrin-like domain-containing protein
VARKKSAARSAATRRRKQRPAPPPASKIAAATTAVRGRIAGAVAAVARKLRRGNAGLDAIQLLEAEHRRFERMLKQGEETTERARKGRRELLATLTAELNIHELMEERVLYPALQARPEAREVVLEGYEEHHVADLIVEELHEVATDDETWAAKFKVLKENIEHHIEEEEGQMFPTARGIFSREELLDLAARMRAVRP